MIKVGKVYKIVSTDGQIYIGSTFLDLKRRLMYHESDVRRFDNGTYKEKIASYDIIKKGNYEIIELESGIYDKKLLRMRENDYMMQFKDIIVNKRFAINKKKL